LLDRVAETGLSCPLNRRMQRHRGHSMSDIFPEQKNQALIEDVGQAIIDSLCATGWVPPGEGRGAAAAVAAFAAIEAGGYRIVPEEPTPEMIDGGHLADRFAAKHENYGAWLEGRRRMAIIYRAMIAARPQ